MDAFAAANLKNWDERAGLHASDTTGSYRIAAVLAGGSSLHAIEAAEIGDLANRDVVHLLFAQPALRGLLRGDNVQPIQDFVEIANVKLSLDTAGKQVTSVALVPGGQALEFATTDGGISFVLPQLKGSAKVVVTYA